MANDNSVIAKLRKLITHEESARSIGSLAEAEAFAVKIQQLLIEHKIEMSQVAASDDHDDESGEQVEEQRYDPSALGVPYNGRQRVAWMENLAGAVAAAHFCRILVIPNSTTFYFVGRATDRLISGNVFAALVRGAIVACDSEYAKAKRDPWKDARGFRRSFYTGFASAVSARLRIQRHTSDQVTSTALVLANADNAVTTYMNQKYKNKASGIGGTSRHNRDAYNNGAAHGRRTSINTAIGNESRGRIGSGL